MRDMRARFVRLAETSRRPVTITIDGEAVTALAGDTILAAVLNHKGYLRDATFDEEQRAGLCLMGSCQDCLVWTVDGDKLQACATEVADGLEVVTVLREGARPRRR